MPVALAEKLPFRKPKDKDSYPATEEAPFKKVQTGKVGEGIRWVKKTRAWTPDSDKLRIVKGIVVGKDIHYDPRMVDETFEGKAINSRKARRLAGVRDWEHNRP